MYSGEHPVSLDDKSRINMPRRFRDIMDVLHHDIWFMTYGFDNSIAIYHRDSWQKIGQQLDAYSLMHGEAIDFMRLFFGGVSEVKPDPQGRLVIPAHLREYAEIEKEGEGVLIGVREMLQLWSKERWLEFKRRMAPDYKGMASRLLATRAGAGNTETAEGNQHA